MSSDKVGPMNTADLDDAFLLEVSQQDQENFDATKLKKLQIEMQARMAHKKPLKRKSLVYVLSKIPYVCLICLHMYVWQCCDVCLSKPYWCDDVSKWAS